MRIETNENAIFRFGPTEPNPISFKGTKREAQRQTIYSSTVKNDTCIVSLPFGQYKDSTTPAHILCASKLIKV